AKSRQEPNPVQPHPGKHPFGMTSLAFEEPSTCPSAAPPALSELTAMNVLVLNSGSSSLKFQVIATDLQRIHQHQEDRICRGEVEGIGGEAIIHIRYRSEPSRTITAPLRDIASTLEYLVHYLASDRSGVTEIKSSADVNAVGHRVVHGGEQFTESAL